MAEEVCFGHGASYHKPELLARLLYENEQGFMNKASPQKLPGPTGTLLGPSL